METRKTRLGLRVSKRPGRNAGLSRYRAVSVEGQRRIIVLRTRLIAVTAGSPAVNLPYVRAFKRLNMCILPATRIGTYTCWRQGKGPHRISSRILTCSVRRAVEACGVGGEEEPGGSSVLSVREERWRLSTRVGGLRYNRIGTVQELRECRVKLLHYDRVLICTIVDYCVGNVRGRAIHYQRFITVAESTRWSVHGAYRIARHTGVLDG